MISYTDYLTLLPKAELHCHFTSTMSVSLLLKLAKKYGAQLTTDDPDRLFDFRNLNDFLVAFRTAHDVLREPDDFAQVAYEGVRSAVEAGSLRYREYYINPQYFSQRGLSYRRLMDPIIDGLRGAERDFGVGFRLVAAISRHESAASALDLVRQVVDNPYDEVVGIGMDDLTPEGTEDPRRFAEAYVTARKAGLRLCAHVGETDAAKADDVRFAMNDLGCDRIDHGYLIMDDRDLVEMARDRQVPFAATPVSTVICSDWKLDPSHRIARMIAAGLNVTISTDDAVFFKTDIGREYAHALVAFGVQPTGAKRIALAGIEAAFCDEGTKRRMLAQFKAAFATLDRLLSTPIDVMGGHDEPVLLP